MKRLAALAAAAALGGCATTAAPPPAAGAPVAPPELAGMQYLYGSGEAAAASRQAWAALVGYVREQKGLQFRAAGMRRGVVLDAGATLARPRFQRCGAKPLAVVFDVDETVLLNLGAEADALGRGAAPFDNARWERYVATGAASVAPTPGAREAIAGLRAMGITIVFNTNRTAGSAEATAQAIAAAGLGQAVHGDTLFLAGDDASGSRKDGRRATIAARFCVVAMAGDQLGDFSDLFNAGLTPAQRRAATALPGIAAMWGHGWFVLPNPVYGTALRGGLNEIFPADKRWHDPAERSNKEAN